MYSVKCDSFGPAGEYYPGYYKQLVESWCKEAFDKMLEETIKNFYERLKNGKSTISLGRDS